MIIIECDIMSDSMLLSIFEKTTIAEINSFKLNDYESSLHNYFTNNNSSDFYQGFFKFFDSVLFEEINNSFLKEYKKWFCSYFF
jgi:hypothetical protein